MPLQRKQCASCAKEIEQGEECVRIQRGKINYSQHVSMHRVAATDDYFCMDCVKAGNVAIRGVA
jgi:hypothetical protein